MASLLKEVALNPAEPVLFPHKNIKKKEWLDFQHLRRYMARSPASSEQKWRMTPKIRNSLSTQRSVCSRLCDATTSHFKWLEDVSDARFRDRRSPGLIPWSYHMIGQLMLGISPLPSANGWCAPPLRFAGVVSCQFCRRACISGGSEAFAW